MALSRRSPAEAPVLFDVDPEPAQDLITGFAGLTLGMETFRGLKRGESANRHVEIKERQRGARSNKRSSSERRRPPVIFRRKANRCAPWRVSAKKLLGWQREKAGSIEAIHDVMKNELAAGVLPCGRFGAHAAWFRMAAIAHNVRTALKRLALPPELLRARPKRLRFLFLNAPGRLVHHARKITLRLGLAAQRIRDWIRARPLLAATA
jgi:hypothetical protein